MIRQFALVSGIAFFAIAATTLNADESVSVRLSPNLPYDVDRAKLGTLDRDSQIPEAQRLFDLFAWQTFIALNWPASADGSADISKTIAETSGPRVWEGWRSNDSIYLPDGAKPQPWTGDQAAANASHTMWRFAKMLDESRDHLNELTESTQAFTGPLVDQNGVFVRYESYVNKAEFDYIVDNELYNQEGQVAFSQRGGQVNFPANKTGEMPAHGSRAIKLAWKQLGTNDIPSRFFTRRATVVSTSYDAQGKMVKTRTEQLMGLVGMHLIAKTQSSPTWIWATFEHVDNVVANDLEFGKTLDGKTARVRPSFNNPDQPAKPINILPPTNAEPDARGLFRSWDESRTTNPVQLTRAVTLSPATAALNALFQKELAAQDSVFGYYELVGTQWPVQPGFPAFGGGAGSAPESIAFKVPGRVVPVYLVNTTMESYFQRGNQPAGPLEEDDRLPSGSFADNPTEAVTPDRTVVFGTESCVGCHFSAGAAIAFKKDENGKLVMKDGRPVTIYGKNASFGQTGSADYVWQFQLKARAKPKS
jgi:hypothetical protein